MNASDSYRNRLIEANRREYATDYEDLRWLSIHEALAAEKRRAGILSDLQGRVKFGCRGTKLDCARLSSGCEICGQGLWSCLFINGKCNCRCFYCPTEQSGVDVPTTQTVQFSKPSDYADYIKKFRFRGMSISGGEPLLTFERSLSYLAAVKKKFGAGIYAWLYTNGTLATRDMLSRLRDAGLDEIRFDIGAVQYSLEKAASAVGIIPRVAVEIPAVPEDSELMKAKIVEMANAGIDFLNLHQLRLTPHNFNQVVRRNYTFLHGEKVTVLESELAALELIRFARGRRIDLPVNYCSFVYKDRFQKAGARRRSAAWTKKSHEDVTENGYIRALCLKGDPNALQMQASRFQAAGCDKTLWSVSGDRLYFSARLWHLADFNGLEVRVSYFEARILPSMTYRNFFVPVSLNREKQVVVEKMRASRELTLSGEDRIFFETQFVHDERKTGTDQIGSSNGSEIQSFESVVSGLQSYF